MRAVLFDQNEGHAKSVEAVNNDLQLWLGQIDAIRQAMQDLVEGRKHAWHLGKVLDSFTVPEGMAIMLTADDYSEVKRLEVSDRDQGFSADHPFRGADKLRAQVSGRALRDEEMPTGTKAAVLTEYTAESPYPHASASFSSFILPKLAISVIDGDPQPFTPRLN